MTEIQAVVNEVLPPPAHHKYGPSKLERLDPKSGGCYAFLSNPETSEAAEHGTLKHTALSTRDLSVLGGDERAEEEVKRVVDFIDSFKTGYPVTHSELTLQCDAIFGTLDHLGLNSEGNHAIIVDAKFGAWGVTHARRNLQGMAYTMLTFHNYPEVRVVRIIFYAAKYGTYSEATFRRHQLKMLETRITRIVEKAASAEEHPTLKDYTPNSVTCSFCVRLNCPARLALMGTLVTQWSHQPVELPDLDLLQVTTPQLAVLKRLSGVFKAFSNAVDAEAKRRAFDDGDVVEGYEIVERSGPRRVIGMEHISRANLEIIDAWLALGFDSSVWPDFIANNVELSVADLEKEIQKVAPKGKGTLAKKIVVKALESAGLVNANTIFSLLAIKE